MSKRWAKSLSCKSINVDDDHLTKPKKSPEEKPASRLLSCSSSSSVLRDVVFLIPLSHPFLPKISQYPDCSSSSTKKPLRNRSRMDPQTPPPIPNPKASTIAFPLPPPPPPSASLPTLANLPRGHSSRRVVEIIFASSWSPLGSRFSGEIEMLFRVRHPPRAVALFEEHRAAVRSRAEHARAAVDGNEMLRFHPAGGDSAIYNASVVRCAVGEMEGVLTFDGSGGAHDGAGGGFGRRAMLVCRVIAGRVGDGSDRNSDSDSVCVGKGKLLVISPRAVLPCFLIIYRV